MRTLRSCLATSTSTTQAMKPNTPVEAEGVLYGKGAVLGNEDVDCQEQSADDVQGPDESRNVAGLVQPIGRCHLLACDLPFAARSSLLGRKDAFEEGLHVARLEKQNQAEKCRQAKGDDAGGWRFVKPVSAPARRRRR